VGEGGEAEPLASLDALPEGITAAGHRVVHGGERFRDPVVIDEEVIEAVRELSSLAPLHNTPALRAIEEARLKLPDVPHVAVFDTAFHATIPAEAATYAVPRRWREQWGVRRYGFHGLAVASVAERLPVRRLVVCHLGGGCSVTAVLDGRSVDTTMGFSPLEGVPMATRSGSVDPGALLYLLRERGLSVAELDAALEHESGLAALGGLDDPLGFAVYTYRIAQAVAAMAVALGGIDALAFSGGVGENREDVRRAVADRLGFLGGLRIEVVPAREDLVVARAVRALLAGPTTSP
jgi:acetate kinase